MDRGEPGQDRGDIDGSRESGFLADADPENEEIDRELEQELARADALLERAQRSLSERSLTQLQRSSAHSLTDRLLVDQNSLEGEQDTSGISAAEGSSQMEASLDSLKACSEGRVALLREATQDVDQAFGCSLFLASLKGQRESSTCSGSTIPSTRSGCVAGSSSQLHADGAEGDGGHGGSSGMGRSGYLTLSLDGPSIFDPAPLPGNARRLEDLNRFLDHIDKVLLDSEGLD